ncbi:response regulator [Nonomuraea sp. NPDC050153]|uniref:response regulator n=1 Tax=Nonomuraea sp. NPDC050153 TaxID=3364359 RepID=UPI0037BDECDB
MPGSQGDILRVYLIDDHEIVRHGLRSFLEAAGDIEVAGEAGDGRFALAELHQYAQAGTPVDVVLLDVMMPVLGGMDVARRINSMPNPPKVVILSGYGDVERVRLAMSIDVAGYILKSSRPAYILDAIRAAHRGELYLDQAVVIRLARAVPDPAKGAPELTPRERDVVALVARGKSNIDIATDLSISERTARTHVSHLLGKLGLESRVQLAIWAIDNGFARSARPRP